MREDKYFQLRVSTPVMLAGIGAVTLVSLALVVNGGLGLIFLIK